MEADEEVVVGADEEADAEAAEAIGRGDINKGRNVSFESTPSAPPAEEDEIIKDESRKHVNRQATITQTSKMGYGFDTTQFDFGY